MTDKPPLPVVLSGRALRDLERIDAYISQFAPLAAQRFTARLRAAVNSLAEQPDRGRPVGQFRELVAVWPYVIRYRISGGTVQIARIKHGAQRAD